MLDFYFYLIVLLYFFHLPVTLYSLLLKDTADVTVIIAQYIAVTCEVMQSFLSENKDLYAFYTDSIFVYINFIRSYIESN